MKLIHHRKLVLNIVANDSQSFGWSSNLKSYAIILFDKKEDQMRLMAICDGQSSVVYLQERDWDMFGIVKKTI